MQGVDEVIHERNAPSPAKCDSRKAIHYAEADDDIRSKFTDLPPNLERVRNRRCKVVEEPEADECWPDDRDGGIVTHFVHIGDDLPSGNPISRRPIPPTNLAINDADLVASLRHPFEEMMGLMGPPFDPIRFLQHENAHGSPTPECTSAN